MSVLRMKWELADRVGVSHKHSSTHLHVSDLQQREEGKAVQVRSQIDQRHKKHCAV